MITNQDIPQVVIVSLDDFRKLQDMKYTKALLDLASQAAKYKVRGPKDLSENLDKYAWGK